MTEAVAVLNLKKALEWPKDRSCRRVEILTDCCSLLVAGLSKIDMADVLV